jgi:iron complex outermembrane receptor protein
MAGMSGSVRGSFNTGPVHHRVVAAYTQYTRDFLRNQTVYPCPVSNIYNLVFAPAPSSSLMPSYDIVQKLNETGLSSAMLGDTLSIFDESVQLTAGVRFHQNKSTSYNATPGAVSSEYDKSAPTPMVGLVVKPWQRVSLYGN